MKTMRKKCLKQSLSILLAFIFACSMIPTAIAAALTAEKSEASKIVREITELREESVKHFLCEDGSYIAATYAVPVHYQENGVWKEIDNSLSLTSRTIDASAKSAYAPKAGSVDVNLPQSFADGQKITARNGEHTLSFGVAAGAKNVSIGKQATVAKVDALPSVVMEEKELTATTNLPDNVVSSKTVYESASVQDYNDEKMAVANQSGAVVYKGIFDDADLEYIVSSNCVKENIVVYAPQETYTYTFNMDFGDLIPAQQKNGSIWLLESADTDEPVFVLEMPYMYDAENTDSYAVTMSLKPNGAGYVVTVEADAEWINSAERTFPVVIDPTFTFASSSIDDMYVINGLGAGSQWRNNELRVGRNLTNLARTYIQVALPTSVPAGSIVSQARLSLKKKSYFQGLSQSDISIVAYDCNHISNLPFNELTWNYQPFPNSYNGYTGQNATFLSSVSASNNTNAYTFDITAAVQRWINETGNNRYLMLASSNENSKTQVDLYSTRVNNSSNYPSMYFTYTLPSVGLSTWNINTPATVSSTIQVTASKSWIAIANQSWLSITDVTTTSFKIRATENSGTSARTGQVTITLDGASSAFHTIQVTQLGADPTLIVSQTEYTIPTQGGTINIGITSNTSWEIVSALPSGISASSLSGQGDGSIQLNIQPLSETASSSSSVVITIQAGTEPQSIYETITVTQLDDIDSYFIQINSDHTSSVKPSSEYNHALATWAMWLSFYAYNPLPDQTLFGTIPDNFMFYDNEEISDTIQNVLTSYGFQSFKSYHYPDSTEGDDDMPLNTAGHSFAFRELPNGKKLIVATIRGTAPTAEWLTDIFSATNIQSVGFTAAEEEVQENFEDYLITRGIDPENCIVLVTGHSLGAAVANLFAADLNQSNLLGQNSESQVYAYTFASPHVGISITTNYTNIFNIINRSDYVPLFPGLLIPEPITPWGRHGQDIPIAMTTGSHPGINHMMGTYLGWMEDQDTDLSYAEIMDISESDVQMGRLPWIVKFKCPVTVKVYDSDEQLIAFESQDENAAEEEIVYAQGEGGNPLENDNDVVSWITADGAKMVFLPFGSASSAAKVTAKAYDYGSMTFSVAAIDVSEDTPSDIKTYNYVSLYPNKEFKVELTDTMTINDVQLQYKTESGTFETITDLNPLLKSAIASPEVVDFGTRSTIVVVTEASVSKIRFTERENDKTYVYNANNAQVESSGANGELLTWTIQRMYAPGTYTFDIGVWVIDMGYTTTQNVFTLTVNPRDTN